MSLNTIFSQRLYQGIKESGLTQKEFAVKANKSGTTVNGWIKGRGEPSFAKIEEIAEILNKPVPWFFGSSENDSSNLNNGLAEIREAVMKAVDPRLEELVAVAGMLSDEHLEAIIKTARVFAGESADEVLGKESKKKA